MYFVSFLLGINLSIYFDMAMVGVSEALRGYLLWEWIDPTGTTTSRRQTMLGFLRVGLSHDFRWCGDATFMSSLNSNSCSSCILFRSRWCGLQPLRPTTHDRGAWHWWRWCSMQAEKRLPPVAKQIVALRSQDPVNGRSLLGCGAWIGGDSSTRCSAEDPLWHWWKPGGSCRQPWKPDPKCAPTLEIGCVRYSKILQPESVQPMFDLQHHVIVPRCRLQSYSSQKFYMWSLFWRWMTGRPSVRQDSVWRYHLHLICLLPGDFMWFQAFLLPSLTQPCVENKLLLGRLLVFIWGPVFVRTPPCTSFQIASPGARSRKASSYFRWGKIDLGVENYHMLYVYSLI